MRPRQPDVTRERILAAAFHEIHRHGFQSASLAAILADTGLTKGALYHHFPAKQDLGLAVIDEVIRGRLDQHIFRPLRESEDPVGALLAILRDKAREDLESLKLGCPLNNLMQEMSLLDEGFRERLNAIIEHWRDSVADALRRGQRQGRIHKDVDCRAAALFIVSAWEGCVGVAKNLQSTRVFRDCLRQLGAYMRSLMLRAEGGDR